MAKDIIRPYPKTVAKCLKWLKDQEETNERNKTIEILENIIKEFDPNKNGNFYMVSMPEKNFGRYIDFLEKISEQCSGCRFWEKSSIPSWSDEKDRGFCVGFCERVPFDSRDMTKTQIAFGGCGHDGSCVTGESFGCIHYEKK